MKKILYVLLLSVVIGACSSSSDNGGNTSDDNFDRSTLLTNVANNIIIPSYTSFQTKLATLKEKTTAFTNTADVSTLVEVRTAWFEAYKAWQHVGIYNIGKAEELAYDSFFNTFPLTAADVDANIASGTYDIDHVNNRDALGFPALDYLVHGVGSNDTEVLEKYTTNANATNYKKYLNDVIAKMVSLTDVVVADWNGAYKNEFINSTGNTATSSLNKLVNDYIFYYEKKLRANKIGIPVGIFSGGTIFPEKVEAYYKKTVSKELMLESLTSVQNFFNGTHFSNGNAGIGLKAYLEAIGREDLATKINNQLEVARTKITTLNDNLSEQIANDRDGVSAVYTELQKVVAMFKVEMLTAINVNVDYVDADGD
ncbi:Predicted lipoprotein [Tenacibaculum sp. MAR_2009_124]|uniref:imelysin family protein n=1 Tax=Tenacibaculum sp. MAR_2009_124 TaxID=1250059 RepID=UPI000898020E|nr:imelysin family protein [Tenacibaculum sp. MAR_2009_124]SEB50180.1 Predicted lipoprotein [Tenacibaculum sp. MAR_2009_124]